MVLLFRKRTELRVSGSAALPCIAKSAVQNCHPYLTLKIVKLWAATRPSQDRVACSRPVGSERDRRTVMGRFGGMA